MVSRRGVAQPWVMRHRDSLTTLFIVLVVLVATGFPASINFWFHALILIWMTVYVSLFLMIPGMLVLWPINAIFERGRAAWCQTAAEMTWSVGQLLIGTAFYAFVLGFVDDDELRLPFEHIGLGTVAVLAMAAAAWWVMTGRWKATLSSLKRLATPAQKPVHLATDLQDPSEPEDAFWSTEPVVAWRSWAWDGSALRGVMVEWPESTLIANCPRCTKSPTWSCRCGIYGVREPDDAHRFYGETEVIGLVEMWGDVIEHKHGYRASDARIIRLWTVSPTIASSLAATYGVEVLVGQPHESAAVNNRSEPALPSPKQAATPPTPTGAALAQRSALPAEVGSPYWSAEPLAAWRGWFWDGSVLRGAGVEWSESWLVATCPDCAEPPTWFCRCGINGAKDRDAIPRLASGPRNVEGRIELWGNVIEHERGYRASHVRIVELWTDWFLVDEIRERYPDVEVRSAT